MESQNSWSRRTFLSTVALTGAAAATAKLLPGKHAAQSPVPAGGYLAFVGFSASGNADSQRIESYRVSNGKWTPVARPIAAESPNALAVHPTLPILYVSHSTDVYKTLPRGSVSSLGIDPATGSLAPHSQEGLALSATRPDHLSISPDGRQLLVSSNGGGSYNFFSLGTDGAVQPTPRPLKETGFGPNPAQAAAHPHTILFNAAGTSAYASDLGTDRISQIALSGGAPTDKDAPAVSSRVNLAPGTGPAEMALHPSGKLLVVSSRLRAGITVVALDHAGSLKSAVHHHSLGAGIGGPIALSASGNRVYVATTQPTGETIVSTFAFARSSGKLQFLQQTPVKGIGRAAQMLRRDDHLVLTGANGVATLPINTQTSSLGESSLVIDKPGAVSIAVQSI